MSASQTQPGLLGIAVGDRPIRVAELGKAHGGIVWVISPDDSDALARAVAMINRYGGPSAWAISETGGES